MAGFFSRLFSRKEVAEPDVPARVKEQFNPNNDWHIEWLNESLIKSCEVMLGKLAKAEKDVETIPSQVSSLASLAKYLRRSGDERFTNMFEQLEPAHANVFEKLNDAQFLKICELFGRVVEAYRKRYTYAKIKPLISMCEREIENLFTLKNPKWARSDKTLSAILMTLTRVKHYYEGEQTNKVTATSSNDDIDQSELTFDQYTAKVKAIIDQCNKEGFTERVLSNARALRQIAVESGFSTKNLDNILREAQR